MLAIFVLASCSFWSYYPDYQSCILFIRILPTISLLGNFPFAPNVLFWARLLLNHVVFVVVSALISLLVLLCPFPRMLFEYPRIVFIVIPSFPCISVQFRGRPILLCAQCVVLGAIVVELCCF